MDKQGLVMEQKPDGGAEAGSGKRRQLDLSVPQVAGSAFAAVVAAVLASQLGVYGTIIGAGLVSVVATCGGTIFQHLFRRTGEQIREVTVQVKPKVLKVPVRQVPGASEPGEAPPTIVVPWPGPSDADRTEWTGWTGHAHGDGEPDATRLLTPVTDEEFTEATTHGTRVRGWKRSSIAALVVFLVAMSGITGYELLSGHGLSGGSGTTVGSVVQGGNGTRHHSPAPAVSTDPQQSQDPQQHDRQPSTGPDPSPSTGSGTGSGDTGQSKPDPGKSGASTDPTPSPSQSATGGGQTPDPTPSGSSGDGSGSGSGHDSTGGQDNAPDAAAENPAG
ncbi:hypothetical protein ACIPW9_30155 [Streptomyces sp. NPDC090052]|uniref:hypothetical protein n=1 Tax=unclassified Streptomyces TaxID=2593676 RepID=UPI00224F0A90|nr:hypothetical protein [Streptomyces sp. NBC_01306]MCX4723260.1 hypothetical protein [Streptomyces sp. NBC_01306]WSX66740.1 hypothetical protein OG221_08990 [Streptomyces sp. NBC_00932]